jgi:hypothetical protein
MAFPDFARRDSAPRPGEGAAWQRTPLAVGFADWLDTPFTRSLPRHEEFLAWREALRPAATPKVLSVSAKRLASRAPVDSLAGLRIFFDSDYVVHRRPGFSLSVRMSSNRTWQTECGNEEGKQDRNMADGVTTAFITGHEFEDIYPVWDWHLVPGTVELWDEGQSDWTCGQSGGRLGCGHFAGGVSDGLNGVASFDYCGDGGIRLHRTWLFMGSHTLVLGSGSSGGGGATPLGNVTISLDQRLLSADGVVVAGSGSPSTERRLSPEPDWQMLSASGGGGWVYHGGVAYSWPSPTPSGSPFRPSAFVGNATGSWARITQTSDQTPVVKAVFVAKIDLGPPVGNLNQHSNRPQDAPRGVVYSYYIHPGVGAASEVPAALSAATAAELYRLNTYDVQAVCFRRDPAEGGGVVTMASLFHANHTAAMAVGGRGCVDISVATAPDSHGLIAMAAVTPTSAAFHKVAQPFGDSTTSSTLVVHVSDPHLASGRATLTLSGVWRGEACTALNATHTSVKVDLPPGLLAGSSVSAKCSGA